MSDLKRPIGRTRDTGWQIGVRRTLPINHETLWQAIVSSQGASHWLGSDVTQPLGPTSASTLEDGTSIEMRVFRPGAHLRLRWHPPSWDEPSTIQVRVIDQGEKAVLAFHQENMPSQADRERRRREFQRAVDLLIEMLGLEAKN